MVPRTPARLHGRIAACIAVAALATLAAGCDERERDPEDDAPPTAARPPRPAAAAATEARRPSADASPALCAEYCQVLFDACPGTLDEPDTCLARCDAVVADAASAEPLQCRRAWLDDPDARSCIAGGLGSAVC
ncbi:MAG: hypothetical protein K1X88_11110 [Nannocystaceae bacterium]|nr:hypothetical protein [Nannocystaceae bacterium]